MASITLSISKKFGILMLGVWLILMGLEQTGAVAYGSTMKVIMGVLAIIAGIVVILDL